MTDKRHKFRSTVPRLPVADVTETLEFYVGKLRFKPHYRFGGEAGVGLGNIMVRFCEGEPIKNENFSIYFEITNTYELFEKYDAEGVEVAFPPKDQPWGSRDFCIKDPNGYRLVFGDFRDQKQPSPLMAAAIETMIAGDIAGLRHLLDIDPELINFRAPVAYRGDRGATLLHFLMDYPPDFSWAGAGLGNMNLVRSFFGESDDTALPAEQRADCLGEEAQGSMNCAFLVAAINGQTEVVEYLLDKGMDVDMQPPGSDFAGIGATPLHWAARFGHRKTVELLLAREADVHARDDVFQLTPAGWAAWFEHEEIKRFLLSKEEEANQ